MTLHITKEHIKTEENQIHHKLYEFNASHFPEDLRGRYEEMKLFLKDAEGNVKGGLLGEFCWNWLEIHTLILDENLRGTGYGSKLLNEAEQLAREKHCDFIKLDTLSFQALDFYKKHGYSVYGTLDNVGRDFSHYYMKKDL
ncbi:GNAT family N-acetyltransferase [Jeotgalibacillus sp. S-D1]|uniref:GNAT family N-acetyltransferase n=1 Tax=Jeotgalibacillus sp. S-D1 TaxID=2552189 RepID=UPI0010592F1E|nr:GNAT family N-acetyltransferase [Jeotgalibacillus sp. S-D1]TDL30943.1 GNAT family N-acetyltransferase [Jeotgalibacillus sp. S-D1]